MSEAAEPCGFQATRLLPWVVFLFRIGLAILFIYGGVAKLIDPRAFARTISPYGLVPETLLPVVAIGLPLVETASGLGLALDLKGSLAVISGLLALFCAVLGYGVYSGLSIDCGCFGAEEIAARNGLLHALWRDVGLMGVAAFLYVARSGALRRYKL